MVFFLKKLAGGMIQRVGNLLIASGVWNGPFCMVGLPSMGVSYAWPRPDQVFAW